jgi:hypothetical protein
MPQVSAELRWFVDATNSAEVRTFDTWFKSGRMSPGGGVRIREDVYAVDSSTDELGVKNREGKSGLEVKVLVEPRFLSLEIGARNATAQLWSKVTSSVLMLPVNTTGRLVVLKTRWLRKFDTSTSFVREIKLGGGPFGEEPIEESSVDIGCNVEWTSIEINGNTHWTFGFEAFAFGQAGPVFPLLEDGLRRLVSTLNSTIPSVPPLGTMWREQSYPAWIRQAWVPD